MALVTDSRCRGNANAAGPGCQLEHSVARSERCQLQEALRQLVTTFVRELRVPLPAAGHRVPHLVKLCACHLLLLLNSILVKCNEVSGRVAEWQRVSRASGGPTTRRAGRSRLPPPVARSSKPLSGYSKGTAIPRPPWRPSPRRQA